MAKMQRVQHEECLRLLTQAQRGDELAHRRLVDIVSRHYNNMISRFYTSDPVLGEEDIKGEFYWGIWRGVHADDGRGDRIFYIAQYGLWSVKSLVTAVNRRRHGTTAKEGGISVVSLDSMYTKDSDGVRTPGWEPPDESIVSDPQGVVEIHEQRGEAKERVFHILVHAGLTQRHGEIVQMLLDGEVDLGEHLARRKIAARLGVSGQRVTQLVGGLESKMRAVDTTST